MTCDISLIAFLCISLYIPIVWSTDIYVDDIQKKSLLISTVPTDDLVNPRNRFLDNPGESDPDDAVLPAHFTFPQNKNSSLQLVQNDTTLLTGNKRVVDAAKEYVIFQIGLAIRQYYLPVVIVVGLVGNTLSFLVMRLRHNRHVGCCILMAALAVYDSGRLIMSTNGYISLVYYSMSSWDANCIYG